MSNFITYGAWTALALTSAGLLLTILKPTQHLPPKFVAGRIMGGIATILFAIGMIVRSLEWLNVVLTLIGCILAIVSLVLILRNRPV